MGALAYNHSTWDAVAKDCQEFMASHMGTYILTKLPTRAT